MQPVVRSGCLPGRSTDHRLSRSGYDAFFGRPNNVCGTLWDVGSNGATTGWGVEPKTHEVLIGFRYKSTSQQGRNSLFPVSLCVITAANLPQSSNMTLSLSGAPPEYGSPLGNRGNSINRLGFVPRISFFYPTRSCFRCIRTEIRTEQHL